ncbi:MAG: hypothetical protein AAF554_13830 [Bacteroidota bacterium]
MFQPFLKSLFTCSVLALLSISPAHCQDILTVEKDFPQKSYALNAYGDIMVLLEIEDLLLSWEEREDPGRDAIRIDTMFIRKRLDEKTFIVQRNGSEAYGLMQRTIIVPDSIALVDGSLGGESVKEVEDKYKANQIATTSIWNQQMLFSRSRVNELLEAPGLDQITRKDLITALNWREEIGENLKAFLEANPDMSPYRLSRFVENWRNQKLVTLGYNPYKQVVYNWEKQFEGDEEVIQMLTQPISFDE